MEDKMIDNVFEQAIKQNRTSLNEFEVYEIFKHLGLNLPVYIYKNKTDLSAKNFAEEIISQFKSEKVVLKIVSHKTLHKTESGGVKIAYNDKSAVEKILSAMILDFPDIEGILACEFLEHSPFALGEEFLLGARSDDAFGPIITIGPGGTNSEGLAKAFKKDFSLSVLAVELAHNKKSLEEFLETVWIWKYCSGKIRGSKKTAEDGEMLKWLEAFVYLMKKYNDESPLYAIEEMEINPLCLYKGKFYALDGVLRFRKASSKNRSIPSMDAVSAIIKPKKIAVVGVSEKKMNMARIILNNVMKAGFNKSDIFVIKEGVEEIDGIKCFARINEVPFTVDLYVVAVPSETVPSIIKEAAESGNVNGVVLISGGMGEKSGSENVAREVVENIANARLKNPAFGLSGGNSLGLVLNEAKVNTLFIPEYKMAYPIGFNKYMCPTAFVSQSGAFVISALSKLPHIKPLYSITVGNQQDITVVDYVNRLIEEDIKVLAVYIEGFKYKDGLNFAKVIKRAREKGKDVIIYKAGRTAVGQKAVMGHTASIAGDYAVTGKILSEAGAFICEDFDEFLDALSLFSYYGDYKIKDGKTFFISNAGFESAGMADSIVNLEAKEVDDKTKSDMEKILKTYKLDSIVDVKNPMDITPMANDEAIFEIADKALASYSAAVISMIPLTAAMNTLPKSEKWPDSLEKSFIEKAANSMHSVLKPVIFCVASGKLYDPYCDYAADKGFVVFRSADRAVKAFDRFIKYKTESRNQAN